MHRMGGVCACSRGGYELRVRQQPVEEVGVMDCKWCSATGPLRPPVARVLGCGRRDLRRFCAVVARLPCSLGSSQWALEDSNLRPQPCEGCALTN